MTDKSPEVLAEAARKGVVWDPKWCDTGAWVRPRLHMPERPEEMAWPYGWCADLVGEPGEAEFADFATELSALQALPPASVQGGLTEAGLGKAEEPDSQEERRDAALPILLRRAEGERDEARGQVEQLTADVARLRRDCACLDGRADAAHRERDEARAGWDAWVVASLADLGASPGEDFGTAARRLRARVAELEALDEQSDPERALSPEDHRRFDAAAAKRARKAAKRSRTAATEVDRG